MRDPLVDEFVTDVGAAEGGDFDETMEGGGGGGSCGMFGSLLWSQADLLGSSFGPTSSSRTSNRDLTRDRGSRSLEDGDGDFNNRANSDVEAAGSSSSGSNISSKESKEHSLVQGLKPMRDKYLLAVLAKMSAPIAQMFPELEGYTGKSCVMTVVSLFFSLLTPSIFC